MGYKKIKEIIIDFMLEVCFVCFVISAIPLLIFSAVAYVFFTYSAVMYVLNFFN